MSTSESLGPSWPGQARLWRTVERLRRSGRIPGALLLIGMRGLPASPYARELADGLVCEAPRNARACHACVDCRLVAAGSHPDRLTVRPEGSQVRIDAVREAVAWAAYRPQTAAVRVVHLDAVDRMGNEAAVAALKSVEEPPLATRWVLSTDVPGRVHPPLLSRCVPLSLRPVATAEMASWLVEHGLDLAQAEALAAGAGGFPEDALDAVRQASGARAGDDSVERARQLRRDLYVAVRAGRVDGPRARAVLSLWALAEQGIRRASPPRLVADVLEAAADLLAALGS